MRARGRKMEDKNAQILQKLTNIEAYLMELVFLTRLRDIDQIKKAVNEELDTLERKRVYELTDGIRSQRDIARLANVPERTISNWWHKWLQVGLIIRSPAPPSRVRKVFSLEDLGLSVSYLDKGELMLPESPEEPFTAEKIRAVLNDKKVFVRPIELIKFTQQILGGNFSFNDPRNKIVDEIIKTFRNSPTLKQQLFIQALEQRLRKDTAAFQKYFESWERNIRG